MYLRITFTFLKKIMINVAHPSGHDGSLGLDSDGGYGLAVRLAGVLEREPPLTALLVERRAHIRVLLQLQNPATRRWKKNQSQFEHNKLCSI